MTAARRRAGFPDSEYPADPYPGARPDVSFVHLDGAGHVLRPSDRGWDVDVTDLDDWLGAHDAAPLADRVAVLAYGSNANPSKITWLRSALGLPGPAVVLRAHTAGLAAVWAAGLRVVDDQRPATLAAMPGRTEIHAVWLATAEQIVVLDVCEGRGERYDLAVVRTGEVRLEDGTRVLDPLAYVARATSRRPLLVDGAMVCCADVAQARASRLAGRAADTDGLRVQPLAPRSPHGSP